MAEDLTEYLEEHGERVRYLHSDIDTVERMETVSYTHLATRKTNGAASSPDKATAAIRGEIN